MKQTEEHKCFGGALRVYRHSSAALACPMRFSVFLPPQAAESCAAGRKLPFVVFLAGLSCTYENFTHKAGAYAQAAAQGLAVIAPDTSPRGADIADAAGYDLGQGAGFYINAARAPWAKHYRMESYIAEELPKLLAAHLPLDLSRQGIMGHSMGGHGALTLALKYPRLYRSVSAFAPIAAPALAPWGKKVFAAYLGDDQAEWQKHDACALMRAAAGKNGGGRAGCAEILIDQGSADPFLERELKPHLFAEACQAAGQKLKLRLQAGYDHSYYFIQSFIGDHMRHHARLLQS